VADVALVCGGAGALGSAIVETLRARGDHVVVADKDTVDLTQPDEVDALWERLEADGVRPRWVVNVAGGFRAGTVAESDAAELRFLLDLNLGTAWWSCRAAAQRLPEGGAIVNVAARAALTGGRGSAGYAVAKAGVVRLTEVLALELAERRVRVNAILPSTIDTAANREQGITAGVPPAELATVVRFLLSDDAAAVSGAAVPVYGWF
jgi:NAD(P)-dependent dehydrogenase (short-subunit alcohol dehydrogenase family)